MSPWRTKTTLHWQHHRRANLPPPTQMVKKSLKCHSPPDMCLAPTQRPALPTPITAFGERLHHLSLKLASTQRTSIWGGQWCWLWRLFKLLGLLNQNLISGNGFKTFQNGQRPASMAWKLSKQRSFYLYCGQPIVEGISTGKCEVFEHVASYVTGKLQPA